MKTLVQKLESRRFVATATDIAGLTRQLIDGESASFLARGAYLKCLIATTQSELGAHVRERAAPKPGRLKAADIEVHVAALDKVHGRFYEAVLTAVGTEGTNLDRNRATGFARTAKSVLRSWVKAGYDLTTLAASRTTQRSLHVRPKQGLRTPIAVSLGRHIDRMSDVVRELIDTDKEAAVEAIQVAMGRLQAALLDLGRSATTKAEVAVRDHRPLRTDEGMFWPPMNSDIKVSEPTALSA